MNGSCIAGTGTIAAATVNPDPKNLSLGWQNNSPSTPIFNATVACGDGTLDKTGNATSPCALASFARNLRHPCMSSLGTSTSSALLLHPTSPWIWHIWATMG